MPCGLPEFPVHSDAACNRNAADVFQNIFQKDAITWWKTLIKQINAVLYYQIDEFAYDLNNDEILKYKICTRESVLKMNFI